MAPVKTPDPHAISPCSRALGRVRPSTARGATEACHTPRGGNRD